MALDPWESRILILRSRLSDRGALLDGYCSWVIEGQIPSVMSRIDQDRMNEPAYLKDIDQAISVQRAFAGIVLRYLVDSYMGSKRADASAWNEALWDMRSRLGSDFADRLVAAMVANMAREYLPVPPEKAFLRAGDAKAAIDLNLYRQLVRADAYVDSESANLPMMRAVLAEHGIENPWREAR
jgi:hypothetical protein